MTHSMHDAQVLREIDASTGLPIGPRVADAAPGPRPERVVLDGNFCRLEPLDPARHGDELFRASTPPDAAQRFLYLFEEPPTSRAALQPWLEAMAASNDPLVYAVIDKRTGRVEGRQTLMRIDPANRVIEIGSIYWGPAIARSAVTTEANFLFARYAFEVLGYRRYEWKCHALNAPSRAAAERFGFTYEGHFRRAVVIKGRIRDTTWYSMIAEDWPQLRAAYERWLTPDNFDAEGRQRLRLSELTSGTLITDGHILRRGATTDLGALEALQRAAYAPNEDVLGVVPIPLQADFGEVLATKEVWLAAREDRLLGTLIVEPYPDHLLIWSVATDPAAQKTGTGRGLLAAAETRARQLGLKTIKLYTGTRLTHLVEWYGRHGYAIEQVEELHDRSITHMTKAVAL